MIYVQFSVGTNSDKGLNYLNSGTENILYMSLSKGLVLGWNKSAQCCLYLSKNINKHEIDTCNPNTDRSF